MTRSDRGLRQSFARSWLGWNPLVCLFFCLFFADGHYLRFWGVSLFISNLVSGTCFATLFAARAIDRARARRRGLPVPVRPLSWYWLLSFSVMPLGLVIAFFIAGELLPRIGVPWKPATLYDYRTGLAFGTMISGISFLAKTRGDARDAVRQAELKLKQLENECLQAQIAALTAQMNPHLLFNALNTIASLIGTDPKRAEDTVLRLCELYRGILNSCRQSTHTLAQELAICRAYLEVETARFGSRLNATIDWDEGIEPERWLVPVFTLQPFVENAVQHGLSVRATGGNVVVRARPQDGSLRLEVEDDGVGIGHSPRTGNGMAIQNCRERLNLAYGQRADLLIRANEAGGTLVSVRLPFVESKEVLT